MLKEEFGELGQFKYHLEGVLLEVLEEKTALILIDKSKNNLEELLGNIARTLSTVFEFSSTIDFQKSVVTVVEEMSANPKQMVNTLPYQVMLLAVDLSTYNRDSFFKLVSELFYAHGVVLSDVVENYEEGVREPIVLTLSLYILLGRTGVLYLQELSDDLGTRIPALDGK